MGELAARHLQEHGAMPVYVANRTWSRAQDLAHTLSGTAVPYEHFAATMAEVDVVITSTAAPEPIVRAQDVERALHSRRHRPLFFIDLAVPRNGEPAGWRSAWSASVISRWSRPSCPSGTSSKRSAAASWTRRCPGCPPPAT